MKYVEIRNIKKTFDKNTSREVQALKGIDLSINKGDFIVVIGGNGSGKSTFLNAVAGNFVVDEGSISIEGKDITKICAFFTVTAKPSLPPTTAPSSALPHLRMAPSCNGPCGRRDSRPCACRAISG